MSVRPDLASINARLAGSMGELARAVTGTDPTSRSGTDWRFRTRGSLAVMIAGPKRGSWFDNEAGCGGDPVGLVAHLRRVPMRDAYAWALAWLGEAPAHTGALHIGAAGTPPKEPRNALGDTPQDDRKRWSHDLAERLWREALAAAGTAVEAYLASRGLLLPADAPLRFHPTAWRNRDNGPPGPALVALMTAAETNEVCGAHVTYLRDDGRGKAAGDKAKVMLGAAGVVRLVPDDEVALGLGLAEGIETALAVIQRGGWAPVWAATSAGAIRRFPVLPGIEALTVFADADASGAGTDAARDCCRRWAEAGREARILVPPAGDWDDVLPRSGRAA